MLPSHSLVLSYDVVPFPSRQVDEVLPSSVDRNTQQWLATQLKALTLIGELRIKKPIGLDSELSTLSLEVVEKRELVRMPRMWQRPQRFTLLHVKLHLPQKPVRYRVAVVLPCDLQRIKPL